MGSGADRRLYRFEPLDGSGVFLGLSAAQCALVGGGLLAAVAAVTAGLPVPVAAVPPTLGAAASFARVKGHRAFQWLALSVRWAATLAIRGRRWFPPLPPTAPPSPARAPVPPPLRGVEIIDLPWRGNTSVGAAHDGVAHTLTAVVPVAGPEFVLADRTHQEQLLAGWGETLNHFAAPGALVTQVAWSDLARPSGMTQHREWARRPERGDVDSDAEASYQDLLAGAAATATTHQVVVSLTVSRDRLPRRAAGRGSGADSQLAAGLLTSLEALSRSLTSAGMTVGDPLVADELRRLVRERIDPRGATDGFLHGPLAERLGLVVPHAWAPLAVEASWGHVRVDGAYHRTYWVASWPRLAVPPSWLEPFLAHSAATRSMTVVFRPVPTYQSRRRIERDLVKLASDAATKEEKGRRVDALHRRATQALLDREEELAAGFAEMAYTGLVTVSAATVEDLDTDCAVLEQVAREAGMELRCLSGRQDAGWAASLPLGLTPRGLLG